MRFPCFLFVLISALALSASCNSERDRQKSREGERQVRQKKVVSDLAAKFGADGEWQKRLPDAPFTLDIQQTLIGPRPIVFVAYLDDLMQEDNKYFARLRYFGSSDNRHDVPSINFILECKPELATAMLRRKFDEVVVVATISSVQKPAIKLESESPTSEDPPAIDVTTSSMFIANGVALDFESLE